MNIIPLLSVTLFSIFLDFAVHAKAKHKVVFLHGSRSHASGDHEFQAGSHLLAKHLNAQKKVDVEAVVNAGWPEDERILDDADAIVIYADGTKVIGHGWEKMDHKGKEYYWNWDTEETVWERPDDYNSPDEVNSGSSDEEYSDGSNEQDAKNNLLKLLKNLF